MEIIQEKWNDILQTIKDENNMTNVSYRTWLLPLEVYAVEDDIIYILYNTPNEDEIDQMNLNYISRKFTRFFQVAIAEATGKEYLIKFIQNKDIETIESTSSKQKKPETFDIEKYKKTNLNQRYTFDTFVVGSNNRFAQSTSLSVAETPGEAYNPLYIYGGPGLGKTHLMHAIGNFIFEQHPNTKVLYVTSEYFVNEVIESVRSTNSATKMSKLREKYRNVDVLMIDDIQFLIGKQGMQEEFFHTFNTLHGAGKQIILTSDRPPKDMETLEERIRTRFMWGLMADIGEPDYATRMAIMHRILDRDELEIPTEVLEYIADNIRSNVREIEGALNKLKAYSKLQHVDITLEVAQKELASIISQDQSKEITAQSIIEEVAEYYNLTMDQMISKDRKKTIARPRQIAMYLCREMISSPLDAIGKLLGGRNHATIIHGYEKIVEEMKTDNKLQWDIDTIKNHINPE
ncbi:MAG: chromosomal replication initiator protein DnaA [Lachnospiraceae bacterium]|nr:chromosomal replication initiator protein DnaA [Lachnospiraceae bacterium]